MKILGFKKYSDHLIIETSAGRLKLIPHAANMIQIIYSQEEDFSKKESLMCIPQQNPFDEWEVEQLETLLALSTKEVSIRIHLDTGSFTYTDAFGNIILKEPDCGGKTLESIDVLKTVFDPNTEIKVDQSVDGMRAHAQNIKQVVDRRAYHTKLAFEWDNTEAIYGLGSHEEGFMNLRGHHQYLYQQNMKAVIPFIVSTKGYGILMDCYSYMTFHDDGQDSYLWSDVDEEMNFYFIYGPEFDQIIGSYRELTGKAPMLPRWAFGYAQSKERYQTQEELISTVKEYRRRNIPLDLIVLDWMSWSGELWGQKSFDPERFPDPKQMMKELHALNTRLMVSIWPVMKNDGHNHKEMKEQGYLLGNQATYDAFNNDARNLYWNQAKEGYFSHGIDAWWCDCTEPFEADWMGETKLSPEERMKLNTGEMKKYLDPEYINAYSLLHSKGIYEGQRHATEEKRVVNLTRSVYAGQQRYSTITWSGDISANWETLRKQIPEGLNFCIAGVPYWSTDIGAFFVNKKDLWFIDGDYNEGCDDLGYRELYVRWFQYGAFLPIFRSHGTDTPREIWRFGEPGSIFYDTLVKFNVLRYRLIPYIYSLAWQITAKGSTLMRGLAFDFRQDIECYDIADQYMFGSALMVCPVTQPMYYGSESRKLKSTEKTRLVYLPKGSIWYDFWTGTNLQGGQRILSLATLDMMPLYVRGGSILPMGPMIQHTEEVVGAPIELRIYRGCDGYFELYEDEGDNYHYEKGAYSSIGIKWNEAKSELTFEKREGSFVGMSQCQVFRIILVGEGFGIGVDQTQNPQKVIMYRGDSIRIDFTASKDEPDSNHNEVKVEVLTPKFDDLVCGKCRIEAKVTKGNEKIEQLHLQIESSNLSMTYVTEEDRYYGEFDSKVYRDGPYTIVLSARIGTQTIQTVVDVVIKNNGCFSDIASREGKNFMLNNEIFKYVGTNAYDLPYKQTKVVETDEETVIFTKEDIAIPIVVKKGTIVTFEEQIDRTLLESQKLGITVLRTWGFNSEAGEVASFYNKDWTFNENQFKRFDYIMASARKHDIRVIITLENYWTTYGGIEAYTNKLGLDHKLKFFADPAAKQLFMDYITKFINRVNTVNLIKYKDDPTLFAWDLMNEPRMEQSEDPDGKEGTLWDPTGDKLGAWIAEMSAYIKKLDTNHMVTVGAECHGIVFDKWPDGNDRLFVWDGEGYGRDPIKVMNQRDIDFLSFHPYPNEEWMTYTLAETKKLITEIVTASHRVNKPIVMQEWGVKKTATIKDPNQENREIAPSDPRHIEVRKVWFEEMMKTFREVGGNGSLLWMLQTNPEEPNFGITMYSPGKEAMEDRAFTKILAKEAKRIATYSS